METPKAHLHIQPFFEIFAAFFEFTRKKLFAAKRFCPRGKPITLPSPNLDKHGFFGNPLPLSFVQMVYGCRQTIIETQFHSKMSYISQNLYQYCFCSMLCFVLYTVCVTVVTYSQLIISPCEVPNKKECYNDPFHNE